MPAVRNLASLSRHERGLRGFSFGNDGNAIRRRDSGTAMLHKVAMRKKKGRGPKAAPFFVSL
jgi:hypothetical protein